VTRPESALDVFQSAVPQLEIVEVFQTVDKLEVGKTVNSSRKNKFIFFTLLKLMFILYLTRFQNEIGLRFDF
jgi:transcription initiation factor TFIIIB Brf1 subunit/transcription initiation factor TFIIB